MTEKGLSDSGCRSAELRYEWQSFLGLLPVLDLQADGSSSVPALVRGRPFGGHERARSVERTCSKLLAWASRRKRWALTC